MIKYVIGTVILLLFVFILYFLKARKGMSENAKKDLLDNLKSFSGSFNALYRAVSEADNSTAERLLAQWEQRLTDKPALQASFTTIKSKNQKKSYIAVGRAWLEQLSTWGLQHDEENQIIKINKDTPYFYIFNDVYEFGDQARILYPCWYVMNDERKTLVEKGAAVLI